MGVGLFAVGFLMEALSDHQLQQHLKDPNPDKGKFCKRGFWRYSRHPNYFGESVIWFGIFCFALYTPKGYWTILSPLFITLLLKYVSGVPLLERKQRKHPEWAKYEAETNVFCPWVVDYEGGMKAQALRDKMDADG